jgi:hypothetical protein
MKLLILCFALTATFFVGCVTMTGYAPGSGGYDTVPNGEKAQAVFSGGDGLSIKQAVIITETANEKTGVGAEYVWLHEHYPGYRLRFQGLRLDGGRSYDEMKITTADGKSRTIFFDITSFFGKY